MTTRLPIEELYSLISTAFEFILGLNVEVGDTLQECDKTANDNNEVSLSSETFF